MFCLRPILQQLYRNETFEYPLALRYQRLEILDLQLNRIGPEGAMALAYAIRHSAALQVVNLKHNLTGDFGGTAFGWMLAMNKSVVDLTLAANHMQLDSAKGFAKALGVNTTLRRLDLSNNILGKVRSCVDAASLML